jgi:hypothetical protein
MYVRPVGQRTDGPACSRSPSVSGLGWGPHLGSRRTARCPPPCHVTRPSPCHRYKANLPRFLFNYLGNLTAVTLPNTTNITSGQEGAACDPNVKVCAAPLACIGWRSGTKNAATMGRCRNTTTNYVPAYSTRYDERRVRLYV